MAIITSIYFILPSSIHRYLVQIIISVQIDTQIDIWSMNSPSLTNLLQIYSTGISTKRPVQINPPLMLSVIWFWRSNMKFLLAKLRLFDVETIPIVQGVKQHVCHKVSTGVHSHNILIQILSNCFCLKAT